MQLGRTSIFNLLLKLLVNVDKRKTWKVLAEVQSVLLSLGSMRPCMLREDHVDRPINPPSGRA